MIYRHADLADLADDLTTDLSFSTTDKHGLTRIFLDEHERVSHADLADLADDLATDKHGFTRIFLKLKTQN